MSTAPLALCLALVAQEATSFRSDRPVARSPEGALVDAYLTRLAAFGFQGAVLVAKDGEVVLERGYGLADEVTGRRNTADTPLLIASLEKPLVSLAILLLESEGQLSIDDPLHAYFDVPPDKEGITLRQLLSHTSGLDDFYRDLSPELSDEEYIRTMLGSPLVAEPGSRFSYSNFGYDLLRELVRRASGATWEEFLHEELYARVGMDRTGFFLPDWSEADVARYQDWGPGGIQRYPARPLDVTEAQVCTFSTVGDLYRLHLALEAGAPLSHEAQHKAYAEVLEGYGLGWRTALTNRGTRVLSPRGLRQGLRRRLRAVPLRGRGRGDRLPREHAHVGHARRHLPRPRARGARLRGQRPPAARRVGGRPRGTRGHGRRVRARRRGVRDRDRGVGVGVGGAERGRARRPVAPVPRRGGGLRRRRAGRGPRAPARPGRSWRGT